MNITKSFLLLLYNEYQAPPLALNISFDEEHLLCKITDFHRRYAKNLDNK